MKTYKDIDPTLLKSIKNSVPIKYKSVHTCNELTFIGHPNQPDFANIVIEIEYTEKIIELKSLKLYLAQFRDIYIGYERLGYCVIKDLQETYSPNYLKITLDTKPRGGISSCLTFLASEDFKNNTTH